MPAFLASERQPPRLFQTLEVPAAHPHRLRMATRLEHHEGVRVEIRVEESHEPIQRAEGGHHAPFAIMEHPGDFLLGLAAKADQRLEAESPGYCESGS